jgi:hypothetical protein
VRSIALSLVALLGISACSAADGADQSQGASARALDVLERTRKVDGTYALYIWNRITPRDKEPTEEWSAEFHSGDLHRVETPRDRLIANCRAGTGVALSLVTGEVVEGPQVAGAACGINRNRPMISAEWLGRVSTPMGEADRVRVVDRDNVRQYDVSREGVLLGATYAENRPGRYLVLTAEAMKLDSALPHADMFDRKSLQESFVPHQFRERLAR